MRRHFFTPTELDPAALAHALEPLLHGFASALAVLDADGKVSAANQLALDLFGGYDLPLLRSHPALRHALTQRTSLALTLTHASRGQRHQIRVVPCSALLLIEAIDTTSLWQLEQQLHTAQTAAKAAACAGEQIRCAYTQALAQLESLNLQFQEQQELLDQALAANAELLRQGALSPGRSRLAAAWRSPEPPRADPAGNRSPHSKRPTGATRAERGEPPDL